MQDNFFAKFHPANEQQGFQVKPADPRIPYQTQSAANAAAASQYAPGTAAAEQQIKQADAANAAIIARAQAVKAEADARAAQIAADHPAAQMNPETRAKALADFNTSQQLNDIIEGLALHYQQGPGATKGIAGLADYLPLTANKQFDASANKARGIVGQALGFTGGQLNTEKEAEKAVGPYIPESGDRDALILDKIGALRDLAGTARQRAIQTLGGIPDANGNIIPVNEKMDASAPLTGSSAQPGTTLSDGKTKTEVNPLLKAIGTKVSHMLATGEPDAAILKYMQDNGVDPASTSINQALIERTKPKSKEYLRQNPGKGYPLGPNFYTKEVPLSPIQSGMNRAAQSPLGSFAINAANGISGDHLKDINPQAETGMELLRQAHPFASFAGDAAGQAMIQSALPMGRLGKFAELGRDAAYGAYSGDGTVGGTLASVGVNTAGGVLGRRLGDVGRVARDGIVPSSSLAYLHDAKVPLTIGAIGRGTNTAAGRAVGGIEDRMAGFPGYDAIVNTARQRSMEGFDRAAFKEAGGSGLTGAAGINELSDRASDAYRFLDKAQIPLDAQYAGANAGVRASLPGMTFGANVGNTMNEIDRNSANGLFSGRAWQDSLRSARDDAGSINGQPFARSATNALGDVQDNLVNLAARQGPFNAASDLAAANGRYRDFRTLSTALDNGPAMARGEVIGPQRLDAAARATGRKFGSQSSSMQGNRPFYSLSKAGMDVLPAQVPDSGTAGRAVLMSALYGGGLGGLGAGIGAGANGSDRSGGAQAGGEIGLGTALALLAPYSKTGQKGIQAALLGERGRPVRAVGEYLTKPASNLIQEGVQKLLGKRAQSAFGSTLLRDILSYQQLPQDY